MNKKAQVVLFTGGRDSTLTASLLMTKGVPVFLLSADSGASIHRKVTKYRIKELYRRFGSELLIGHQKMDVSGSFRLLALKDIEEDILTDKKNLVVMGEKLAIMAHTINFCKRNGYTTVNCGYAKYQEEFPEQREQSVIFLEGLLEKYGIKLNCPIYNIAESIEDVKYRLMELGLSNKPLEGSTIFSDTFSVASDDTIKKYLSRKESLLYDHINFLNQGVALNGENTN